MFGSWPQLKRCGGRGRVIVYSGMFDPFPRAREAGVGIDFGWLDCPSWSGTAAILDLLLDTGFRLARSEALNAGSTAKATCFLWPRFWCCSAGTCCSKLCLLVRVMVIRYLAVFVLIKSL